MKEQYNQKFINLHHKSALIQTDFNNQLAWEELVAIVKEGDGFNKPDLNYISNSQLNLDNDLINLRDYVIDVDECLLDIDYIFLQAQNQQIKCVNIHTSHYFTIQATDVWFVDWEFLNESMSFYDFWNVANSDNVLELPLPITELKPIPPTQDFPYFGQGIATGAKWAIIYILFKDAINIKIKSSIPVLLRKDITIDGNLLTIQSSHFIATKIEARYGLDKTADLNLDVGAKMHHEEECFHVSPLANQLFENDIEQWLLKIHDKMPIIAVARGFDGWVEAVTIGDWQQGFISLLNLAEQLIADKQKYAENHFHFMESSLFMVKTKEANIDVPELFLDTLLPKTRAIGDVERREIKTQSVLLQNNKYYLKIYFLNLWSEINRKREKDSIKKLADSYLKVEHLIDTLDDKIQKRLNWQMEDSPQLIIEILSKVTIGGNKKLMMKYQLMLYNNRMNSTIFNLLSREALSLLQQKKYRAAFHFYNILLEKRYQHLVEKDTSIFNNLLWLLQKENTGWPINRAKNLKYIKIALVYANDNPTIYSNAACLHVEMKAYEIAVDLLNSFFEHIKNESERKTILQQVTEEDFFKPVRDIVVPAQLNKWRHSQ